MESRRRILVIRNSALGDVAMTLPVLYSVAGRYPDADFYLLTRPFFAGIFLNRPSNLHIVEADFKKEYKGVRGMCRLLRRLATYRFTDVADLHNVLRSWVIDTCMLLRGKRVRMVDKARVKRRGLMHTANRTDAVPFIERYAQVFARLGLPASTDFAGLFTDDEIKSRTKSLPKGGRKVGIAPFARYATKTYPPEMMERVVDILSAAGVQVYLFGARGDEAAMLARWQDKYPGCISLAGKMAIEDELAAMAAMDLMVAMDSANHHLASIAGTRTLSIWGGTTPACGFAAYGQKAEDSMYACLDCQPCSVAGTKECPKGTLACFKALAPETVASRIMTIIQGK